MSISDGQPKSSAHIDRHHDDVSISAVAGLASRYQCRCYHVSEHYLVRSVSDKNKRNISVLVKVAKLRALLICIPKNTKPSAYNSPKVTAPLWTHTDGFSSLSRKMRGWGADRTCGASNSLQNGMLIISLALKLKL